MILCNYNNLNAVFQIHSIFFVPIVTGAGTASKQMEHISMIKKPALFVFSL